MLRQFVAQHGKLFNSLIVAVVMFVAAIIFQSVSYEPKYLHPGTLAMDAPKRSQAMAPWLVFVLVNVLVIVLLMTLDDIRLPNKYAFLAGVSCHLSLGISLASLVCSIFHMILGTPRPDSIAMCNSETVNLERCATVLTGYELTKQYQSFPAIEAAVVMAGAAAVAQVLEIFSTGNLLFTIFKSVVVVWAIFYDAILVGSACYRIEDVVAGSLIGFVCAWLTFGSIDAMFGFMTNRRDEHTDVSTGASFRIHV